MVDSPRSTAGVLSRVEPSSVTKAEVKCALRWRRKASRVRLEALVNAAMSMEGFSIRVTRRVMIMQYFDERTKAGGAEGKKRSEPCIFIPL